MVWSRETADDGRNTCSGGQGLAEQTYKTCKRAEVTKTRDVSRRHSSVGHFFAHIYILQLPWGKSYHRVNNLVSPLAFSHPHFQ